MSSDPRHCFWHTRSHTLSLLHLLYSIFLARVKASPLWVPQGCQEWGNKHVTICCGAFAHWAWHTTAQLHYCTASVWLDKGRPSCHLRLLGIGKSVSQTVVGHLCSQPLVHSPHCQTYTAVLLFGVKWAPSGPYSLSGMANQSLTICCVACACAFSLA
jgi:hypothetical protein